MQVYKIKKDWKRYIKVCKGESDCRVSATVDLPSVSLDDDALKLDGTFNAIGGKYGKSRDVY